MLVPLVVTSIALGLTALFIVMLMIERARGVRYLGGLRTSLDGVLHWGGRAVARRVPQVHGGMVRAIFHYLAHQCLSVILKVIRKSESVLVRIVHFNRSKALRAAQHASPGAPDSHLRAIAEHKESVSLTPAEKRKRKHQALRGD